MQERVWIVDAGLAQCSGRCRMSQEVRACEYVTPSLQRLIRVALALAGRGVCLGFPANEAQGERYQFSHNTGSTLTR